MNLRRTKNTTIKKRWQKKIQKTNNGDFFSFSLFLFRLDGSLCFSVFSEAEPVLLHIDRCWIFRCQNGPQFRGFEHAELATQELKRSFDFIFNLDGMQICAEETSEAMTLM